MPERGADAPGLGKALVRSDWSMRGAWRSGLGIQLTGTESAEWVKRGRFEMDLVFIRDAGPEDWRALPRKFVMGEIVQKFVGHTYGLDRDDMIFLGKETIPCTCEGSEGFFTVPVEFLAMENGKQPMGAYVRYDA